MYINKNESQFSKREIAAALQIWNRAAVSLLDIRHNLISPEKALHSYRLPASAFLYTSGGRAEVLLNATAYNVDRFGLFHGGKGTEITLIPQCEWLEYYLVLYKAGEPPFHRREFVKLLEQTNPFQLQYGFAPENPIFISELLRKMYDNWIGPTPLNLFFGKTAFYQLVYAVYEALEQGSVSVLEPDSVAMAKRYLDEHYSDEISVQELCGILGISYSHFYKSFKERTGVSPQEYLIQARLSAAKHWLEDSDMPMRFIAESCGFADERSFYRLFSKRFGLSPNTYRKNSPVYCEDNAIGNVYSFPYNEESQVSLGELKGKGATYMFKQMSGKAVAAAALSLMMLMSACGTAPVNSGGADSAPAVTTSQAAETEPVEEGMRIVSTVMGDVEVPVNPQRVVVNGWWVGDVVAFGITPAAIQDLYSIGNGYESQTEGVKRLEKWEVEDIMAESPDLIITGYERNYEDLSKIAPTVFVAYDMPDEERLPLIAQALGKEAAEGTALLEALNERIAEAKARLKDAGILDKTITVCRSGAEGGLEIQWANWWGGSIIYDALGMPIPDALQELAQQDTTLFSNMFSFEVLPQYIGDYVLINHMNEAEKKALQENTVWNAIPAVKNGNIIEIDSAVVFFTDISSQNAQLDLITEALLKLSKK